MSDEFDIAIIGSGPAGYEAALRARELGLSVILIERDSIGGTCLNRGCIPTKALLHSSGAYRCAAGMAALGVAANGLSFDFAAIIKRKDSVVTSLREGLTKRLAVAGVEIARGSATVEAPGLVSVRAGDGRREIRSRNVLVSVGSRPSRPPIAGMDVAGVYDSDAFLSLPAFPPRAVIVGGGVIGIEFATFLNDLGSKVTIVEAAERVLPLMDKEISQNLSMILKRRGVTIHVGAKVEGFSRNESGAELSCAVTAADGSAITVLADAALVATGRVPNVGEVFASGLGVTMDGFFVAVNDRFETSVAGVYAVGDAIRGIQLAHAATAQGIAVVERLAGLTPSYRADTIPSCVYAEPEIATVGMTIETAAARGIATVAGKSLSSMNARAVINAEDRGFAKLIFEDLGAKGAGKILGASLVCARASDLAGEISTAIAAGLTARELASVVRPHPSYSEMITAAAREALR